MNFQPGKGAILKMPENEYEIDAYYTGYLYDGKYVDIYGRKRTDVKGVWSHEEASRGFVEDWNKNMG